VWTPLCFWEFFPSFLRKKDSYPPFLVFDPATDPSHLPGRYRHGKASTPSRVCPPRLPPFSFFSFQFKEIPRGVERPLPKKSPFSPPPPPGVSGLSLFCAPPWSVPIFLFPLGGGQPFPFFYPPSGGSGSFSPFCFVPPELAPQSLPRDSPPRELFFSRSSRGSNLPLPPPQEIHFSLPTALSELFFSPASWPRLGKGTLGDKELPTSPFYYEDRPLFCRTPQPPFFP